MSDDESLHLLLYEYVPDVVERRKPHREAHLGKIAAEREAGHLERSGPFEPPTGAAFLFTGVPREHVEAFVADDPYQRAGLITSWRIERWKLV